MRRGGEVEVEALRTGKVDEGPVVAELLRVAVLQLLEDHRADALGKDLQTVSGAGSASAAMLSQISWTRATRSATLSRSIPSA